MPMNDILWTRVLCAMSAAAQEPLPGVVPAPVEQPLRNYAVFYWWNRTWVLEGRYTLKVAVRNAGMVAWRGRTVIIDLVSGHMVYNKGQFTARKRPVGIKNLPEVEVHTD